MLRKVIHERAPACIGEVREQRVLILLLYVLQIGNDLDIRITNHLLLYMLTVSGEPVMLGKVLGYIPYMKGELIIQFSIM